MSLADAKDGALRPKEWTRKTQPPLRIHPAFLPGGVWSGRDAGEIMDKGGREAGPWPPWRGGCSLPVSGDTGGAFGHSSGAKLERRGESPRRGKTLRSHRAKGSKLGAQRPNPVPSQVVSDTSMPKTFKLADFAHTHARTLQTYLLSPAYSERKSAPLATPHPCSCTLAGAGRGTPFRRAVGALVR